MKKKTLPPKLGPQRRSLSIRAEAEVLDGESRTLRLSFSSETPCDMWYGTEVLSHESGCVRMDRAQASMPLLFNHNRSDLLGVVESIEIGKARRGYAVIRFGRDERGEWALQQARDGVLVNVSFMYRVYKYVEDVENDTITAIDWEPYEISLVTIPADHTVGVGRAGTTEEWDVEVVSRSQQPSLAAAGNSEENTMRFKKKHVLRDQAGDAEGGSGSVVVDAVRERQSGAEAERKRIDEIEALCRQHQVPDEVRRGLIQKGATVDAARGAVLDLILQRGQQQKPLASLGNDPNPDMTEKEKARYSMIRAINAVVGGSWKEAGFELEVSNEIAKRSGKSGSGGFFMPTNLTYAMRAPYMAGAPATGGALVGTQLLSGSFIDLLRNKARVMQLGATVLSGLTGNVDIPRQIGSSQAFWVAEGVAVTESEATFDKVSLSMKSVGTYSMVSRNMLIQSSPDIEMLVRADLLSTIALGIDLAALSGTGAGGQPLGIANVAGVGSVAGGANGAGIIIDHLIDLETAVMDSNAPEESLAYLCNPRTVGALKKLKSTTGDYLWSNLPNGGRSATPGEINGYAVARSKQARNTLTKGTANGICSELFFGAWNEVLIGEWGVIELLPNPYDPDAYKQGAVLIRALQSVDVAVRHAKSFAVMSDALTS